ncbi:hypothetical protein HS7_20610 [Sulfolobales archaeon HS-7]|nr:hypothetical protein HS7_20610 [Sulfolobales archaeon HS-7]
MNILWNFLNSIISFISSILQNNLGISSVQANELSIEILIALSLTITLLLLTYAPISRKLLYFLVGIMWALIFLALV